MNSNTDTLATSLSASITDGAQRLNQHADDAKHEATRMAGQAGYLARCGLDSARALTSQARERATALRDTTASHVQTDPMKAMLVAAAAGAAAALVVQWLAHPRLNA